MTNVLRRSMAVTLALCLAGCAITSPKLTPSVPVAGTWNEGPPTDATAVSPTWWESFGSADRKSTRLNSSHRL